jgi:hypothetical protein
MAKSEAVTNKQRTWARRAIGTSYAKQRPHDSFIVIAVAFSEQYSFAEDVKLRVCSSRDQGGRFVRKQRLARVPISRLIN